MSTRPTIPIPTWSTSGSNIEPSAGKKAAGWQVNERPPAEWLNWLDNSAGQWLQFLADVTAASPTTDLQFNFANPNALVPAVDVTVAPAASAYKLILRALITPTIHAHIYAGTTQKRLVVTHNALWNGSAWRCEDTTAPAQAYVLRASGTNDVFELLFHASTASTWSDAGWSNGVFNNLAAGSLSATSITTTTIHATSTGTGGVFDGDISAVDIACTSVSAASVGAGQGTFTHLHADDAEIKTPHLYLYPGVDIVHPTSAGPQPQRLVMLPLSDGIIITGQDFGDIYDPIGGFLSNNAAATLILEYPIRIPRHTLKLNVYACWMAPSATYAHQFSVLRADRDFNMASFTPGDLYTPGSDWQRTQNLFSTTFAYVQGLITPIDLDMDNSQQSFLVRVGLPYDSGGQTRFYGFGVKFDDPGPRNG